MQGQQGQGNIALGMQNQVANAFANPINTASLPGLTSTINPQDVNTQVQNAENAAYNAQAQYLDPRFAQQRAQLANQDANMGITRGSQAWNTDQLNQNLAQNQAYQSAQNAAVAAGQQEQNTLFGQAAQQAQLQNQANQQGLTNLFALQNQPLNSYDALMSGAQVQQPNFVNVPNPSVAPTDVAGITQNAFNDQMAAYNASMAANPLNALFSLGGSLGSAYLLGPH